MTEYTPATIERVRSLARQGWPPGAVASMMSWDIPRLHRFVERHQIRFWKFTAKSKTPDLERAKIRWDGKKAWHGRRSIVLPPAEGRLFGAIVNAGAEHDLNMETLGRAAQVPKKNVSAHVSMLRSNLESIGLTLTHRYYEIVRL